MQDSPTAQCSCFVHRRFIVSIEGAYKTTDWPQRRRIDSRTGINAERVLAPGVVALTNAHACMPPSAEESVRARGRWWMCVPAVENGKRESSTTSGAVDCSRCMIASSSVPVLAPSWDGGAIDNHHGEGLLVSIGARWGKCQSCSGSRSTHTGWVVESSAHPRGTGAGGARSIFFFRERVNFFFHIRHTHTVPPHETHSHLAQVRPQPNTESKNVSVMASLRPPMRAQVASTGRANPSPLRRAAAHREPRDLSCRSLPAPQTS